MTPLLGFTPDTDAVMPGVITDCVNFIPYIAGMEGGPTAVTPASTPALAGECLGAGVVTSLSGVRRVLAGTAARLYELSGGTWLDVSRATVYAGGVDTRWMFAQFGDATIAASRADILQRSLSGAFADIAGAPKAEVVFSVGSFVMALNVVDDEGVKADGWHCCAAFDDTSWKPSITTQATRGRLVSTAGPITAGMRLGEYAVAYKAKSIYIGQYVGAPAVWDWIQAPGGEAGCVGKEAICDIGGAHFFVGNDNFWLFDGTRPQPLLDNVLRQWFYDNSNPAYRYKIKTVFDRQTMRVWVFYPSSGASSCDSALVYHVLAKKWGRANHSVQAALSYIAPGLTFDTFNAAGASFDTLPNISYDSQFWISGGQALSAFNTSNQLQLLTGASDSCSFTGGDIGDDDAVALLKQLRLRYAAGYAPATASVQTWFKMNSGDALTLGSSGIINDGKFDTLKAARWHRAKFTFTGPVRVTGMLAQAQPAGRR